MKLNISDNKNKSSELLLSCFAFLLGILLCHIARLESFDLGFNELRSLYSLPVILGYLFVLELLLLTSFSLIGGVFVFILDLGLGFMLSALLAHIISSSGESLVIIFSETAISFVLVFLFLLCSVHSIKTASRLYSSTAHEGFIRLEGLKSSLLFVFIIILSVIGFPELDIFK